MKKNSYKINQAYELEPGAEKDADRPVGDFTPSGGDFTPLTYSWNNIDVHTKPTTSCCGFNKITETKHILKDVSGICRPGELLAIMGASGAGKTTLLNVLTGRSNELLDVTGDLQLNGQSIRPYQLANRSAYVQQDDLFIGTMTVKEQLVFQARLRMDRKVPQSVRMDRVREVISELGLTKCQNTYIGIPGKLKGISGGETKRLAFACEVLTNPPLMFCDEPTTGLDSFMAQTIVEAMRGITRQGHTIISTIHQPSSEVFSMFDRVLLMAEGRIAFLGLTSDALEFFKRSGKMCPKNFNPADFFIACLAVNPECEDESRLEISKICDKYDAEDGLAVREMVQQNKRSDDFIVEDNSPMYKTGYFGQFSAVFKRSIFQVIRQPDQLRIKAIQTIMLGVLIGLLFLNQELNQAGALNLQSCLFLMLTNMSFNNAFSVVNTFCADLTVVRREHENMMYRSDVFFWAKCLAELPVILMQPVVFVGVIYYMVGLYQGVENFFICMGITVLIANIGVSYGYLISCMSKSLEMAMAISAPLLIPLMVFGGFLINSNSVPVWYVWLQYISWFNYGNEALSINQWRDVDSISCSDLSPAQNSTCKSTGQAQLEFFAFKTSNFGFDIGMLVVLLVGYRLLAFIFLYIKFYRRKSD